MVRRVIVHMMRHEKTAGNIARQYVGQTDDSIVVSDRKPVTEEPFTLYGSTLSRCQQTAALYFPHATYIGVDALREIHFGDFEMKTYEQLQHNANYRAWIDDPFVVTPPNGEPFRTFIARVEQGLTTIIQQAGTYRFVVHGGIIRYMKARSDVATFQQATATHRMLYTFIWDTFDAFKEGAPCISYSEGPITAKQLMQNG